jgi:hypothetical protein
MTKMNWICPACSKEFLRDLKLSSHECCSGKCDRDYKRKKKEFKLQVAYKTGLINGKPIIIHFYNQYKRSAEYRHLDFLLTLDEFSTFWKQKCYYCDDDIETIGIDRKDNYIGYQIDNCVTCCTQCNLMKRNVNHIEFIEQCNKISNMHSHRLPS